MQSFDKCRSYAEVVKCGVMHDHVYSHNISDRENIYEIYTTNHVDHSYSYYSPTENPDLKEPEKIQSTPYFKTYIQHEHDYYQSKIEFTSTAPSVVPQLVHLHIPPSQTWGHSHCIANSGRS